MDNLPPWDGALYAANTAHHRAHDEDFLASTPLRPTDRVLDLGCGSGDLTATIAGLVPEGHVVGVDPQPSMLEEARGRARPNQSFVQLAAQQLDQLEPATDGTDGTDGGFDVVLSRSCLHWVPRADWPGVLAQLARLVRPGGAVRIECGGAGNVPLVVRLLGDLTGRPCPWTFLDAGEALHLLEAAGMEIDFVRTVGQRRPFDEASMIGWLRSQCFQAYALDPDEQARAEARLDELRRDDGTLDQTYVRLDLLARG